MKHLLTLLSCVAFLFSCKAPKQPAVPPAEFKEKIVERLVPYQVPADSAQFYALLECDSLNHVILKEFSELKSKGVQSSFSLNQNALSYNAYRPPDTGYVKATDSVRIEKIPYAVEVPVKVNELTKFQAFQIQIAWILEIAAVCYLAFRINWKNIFNTIKNLIK